MRPVYFALTALVLIGLTGCVKTAVTGFTDVNYQGYRIKKVAVRVFGNNLQSQLQVERIIGKKLVDKKVPAESFITLFPPTRAWTESDVARRLDAGGFDVIMYVSVMSDEFSSQVVGYHTSGQSSTYGTATYNDGTVTYRDQSTSHSTTTPDMRVSRSSTIRVTLYEVETANIIWVGDCNTQASGTLYMSNETQINSFAGKLIGALRKNGHIP